MAIDDSTNYTLTGAQVKDLAARIKGAAGAVIYYVGETFFTDGATGQSVYSDSALTTTVTATAMAAEAEAGKLLYLFELDSRNDVVSIHEISYVAPPGMDDGEFSILYGTSIWDIFYVPGDGWSVNEKPIPTVNNATLTIQHNGTTVNTFTANASTNKTANVETIYADPIASSAAITPLVQTSMIADGAVTPAKLSDTGWVLADQYVNTTYFSPRTHIYYRILGGVVYWQGQIYCHTAPSRSDHTEFLLSGLPNNVMPAGETSATGQQFMIANGIYNLWTENNGIRVWEASQQIPVTNYWEGYDLTRLHYISSDY